MKTLIIALVLSVIFFGSLITVDTLAYRQGYMDRNQEISHRYTPDIGVSKAPMMELIQKENG